MSFECLRSKSKTVECRNKRLTTKIAHWARIAVRLIEWLATSSTLLSLEYCDNVSRPSVALVGVKGRGQLPPLHPQLVHHPVKFYLVQFPAHPSGGTEFDCLVFPFHKILSAERVVLRRATMTAAMVRRWRHVRSIKGLGNMIAPIGPSQFLETFLPPAVSYLDGRLAWLPRKLPRRRQRHRLR